MNRRAPVRSARCFHARVWSASQVAGDGVGQFSGGAAAINRRAHARDVAKLPTARRALLARFPSTSDR